MPTIVAGRGRIRLLVGAVLTRSMDLAQPKV
jgi:hypothetical protein